MIIEGNGACGECITYEVSNQDDSENYFLFYYKGEV